MLKIGYMWIVVQVNGYTFFSNDDRSEKIGSDHGLGNQIPYSVLKPKGKEIYT